tara:strand:+ start:319 stop:1461 length:1143 start_codon:yes stop_codon:yes gene_type:complete
MNAGNASGYTKEQIAGMKDPSSIPTSTSPRSKQNFLSGEDRYLSYPIARNNQEITGDTLRIKCIEYVASGGKDFQVKIDNFYGKEVKDGKLTGEKFIINNDQRIANEIDPVKITPNFRNADTRIRTKNKNNKLTKYNIELPMPQEIQDSQSVTWGDDKINAIELAGASAAGRLIEQGGMGAVNDARKAIQILNAGISIPGVTAETQNAIRAGLAGAAINALGGNVTPQSLIARTTGQVLNNNLELLFNGVNLRTFPYSITFSPRNPDEADVVKKIIRALKMSMSAKAGEFNQNAQGLFIKSPDLFQLQYLRDGEEHPFLNNFKICALTGMNINYTNSGTYASYNDGTPVNIRMDVTFKEINPVYAEDYLPGNGSGMGVGF